MEFTAKEKREKQKRGGGVELTERNQKRKENRGKSESGVTGGKQRKKQKKKGRLVRLCGLRKH